MLSDLEKPEALVADAGSHVVQLAMEAVLPHLARWQGSEVGQALKATVVCRMQQGLHQLCQNASAFALPSMLNMSFGIIHSATAPAPEENSTPGK